MAKISCELPLKLSTIRAAINSAFKSLAECVAGSTRIDKSLDFPMSRFRCFDDEMYASLGLSTYYNQSDTTGTVILASQLSNNPVGIASTTLNFSVWRDGVQIGTTTITHNGGVAENTRSLDYAREEADFDLTFRCEPGAGYYLQLDAQGNPSQVTVTVVAKVPVMVASQGDAFYKHVDDLTGNITWASQLTNNTVGVGDTEVYFSLWRDGVQIDSFMVSHPEGVFKHSFTRLYNREDADYSLTLKSEPGAGYDLWKDAQGNPSQMTVTVVAKVPVAATVPVISLSATRDLNHTIAGEEKWSWIGTVDGGAVLEADISGEIFTVWDNQPLYAATYNWVLKAGTNSGILFIGQYPQLDDRTAPAMAEILDSTNGTYTVNEANRTKEITISAAAVA
ncbi:hypothetical protein [Pontibacter pamirensis]|uniref:hypothetical protein n=1 Tax=Pontibacter pamirensis TaxID=2562824 RepID=UPI001389D015|nr:hypothetical protein [Pontibacter pamirensis]